MNISNIWCISIFIIILCEIIAHKNKIYGRSHHQKNITKLRHRYRNNSKSVRRTNDPMDDLQKKLGKFARPGKIETYYEPYWHSGEWVFLRITTKKGETTPIITTLIPGVTQKKFKKWPMSIYRDCDLHCLNIYKDFYGPVCAQRYNTMNWKNEYKTFDNMCELERENCKTPNKRPMWYPIHREKFCDELTTFKLFPTNPTLILERKTSWAPYEYLRTKTTPIPFNVTVKT